MSITREPEVQPPTNDLYDARSFVPAESTMTDKISHLPISLDKALRRRLKNRYVPCEVSSRYLVFPETSSRINANNDFMFVDVMTATEDNQSRKLCQLVLNRHALVAALAACETDE